MTVHFIVWWAGLAAFGLGFLPVAERVFPSSFPDRGRPLARPLALVAFAYVAWLLTSAGLPHRLSLGAAGIAFAAAAAIAWRRRPPAAWRAAWLRDEAVFVAALALFAALRALQPDIFGAEKYMDFAFFNTLRRAEHFPPQDPWMSGVTINYYYFGYLLFADLARLTRIPSEVAYNLSLATVGAVLVAGAVSIGRRLAGRAWGGALAAAVVALIGNLDAARQLLLERRTAATLDHWRPTRVIPNTINEFPFFSLLHGDLHPHVTALLIDVTLIGVALAVSAAWAERPRSAPRGGGAVGLSALALLFGSLALTNPWDVPVMLALLGALCLHALWRDDRPFDALIGAALLAGGAAVALTVLSLPFTMRFHAQFHGIGRVHERTAIVPFLTVFAVPLLPAVLLVGRRGADQLADDPPLRDLWLACAAFSAVVVYAATQSLVLVLAGAVTVGGLLALSGPAQAEAASPATAIATVAAAAIAAGELVFLRDPYGTDLHRMNTIFKLYFQAWLLLGLAFPALLLATLRRSRRLGRLVIGGAVLIGLAASLAYPAAVIYQRWRSLAGSPSLDGLAYLDRDHPSDAAAIRWLSREVSGLPVVLEATGEPYSYFARVSANTGLPTPLGWGNHQSVWRGPDPRIARRSRDVDRLYAESDLGVVRSLLERYRVRYVFVGDLERQRYSAAALGKFAAHPERFAVAYRSGTTEVFAVRETTDRE